MRAFTVLSIHIFKKLIFINLKNYRTIGYLVTTIQVFEYNSEITNGPIMNSTIWSQLFKYQIYLYNCYCISCDCNVHNNKKIRKFLKSYLKMFVVSRLI